MNQSENKRIHDTTLYKDIPAPAGRLPREMAVYELLKELEIPYQRIDHEPMATIEDCHGVDALLGIRMCKNLFLCNSQKSRFYLLMMPGEKKFLTREVSRQIGSARLSFAPKQYMEEYLQISPGAVSIMGLMNDRGQQVQLLIDEELLQEEYLGCHPCVNTASMRLKTGDVLEKFLPYVGHAPIIVRLTGGQMPEQGGLEIRAMTSGDYDGVRELWLSIKGFAIRSLDDSKEGVEAFLKRNPGCSVVAVENGRIVGSILCGHDGRRGCLYHVCVQEDHRMRGIGKSMVVYCMNALRKEKISKVSLIAFTRNDVGNAFWKEIGWTRREDLNYYDFTLNEENIVRFNG